MTDKGFPRRMRCGPGPRQRLVIAAKDDAEADARAARIRVMVDALCRAGWALAAATLMRDAAAARLGRDFAAIERAGLDLAAKPKGAEPTPVPALTYREVVRRWLSGELHALDRRLAPYKGPKSVAQDWSMYNQFILAAIGDKPIALVTADDCKELRKAIPSSRRDGTYARYCGLIRRPLLLAEKFGFIERSPVGEGFVPMASTPEGKSRTGTYMYPDEDRAYLGDRRHPLVDRLVYGFCARNGTRPGEAAKATWGDVDVRHRTFTLDENKTKSPRQWYLEEDSFEMLVLIRPSDAEDSDLIFAGFDLDKAARRLQAQLAQTEGCERRELLASTKVRRPICMHHAGRATFVTLALASAQSPEGAHRTEMWVRDRTGHTTDREMQTYRRLARFAAEHHHTGWLTPLVDAVPELARLRALRARQEAVASGPPPARPRVGQSLGQSGHRQAKTAQGLFSSPNRQGALGEAAMSFRAGKAAIETTRESATLPPGPPETRGVGQGGADPDWVLQLSLERATADRQYELAAELVAELRERRRLRTSPDLVSLDEERRRRR